MPYTMDSANVSAGNGINRQDAMSEFRDLLTHGKKPVIGMLHVPALPGTYQHKLSIPQIIDYVLAEAQIYASAGLDAVMLENMHDLPYLRGQAGPEIVASLTAVASAVKATYPLPCGLQVLAAANREALAIALATGMEFIRVENYIYSHVADEGIMNSCAGDLKRYQKQIGAENVLIFTDLQKKHSSHALTSDLDLATWAETAEFFLSDGLIITGTKTGEAPSDKDLKAIRHQTELPVIIGSGLSSANLAEFFPLADGFIIGSHFKQNGHWASPVSADRVRELVCLKLKLESDNTSA